MKKLASLPISGLTSEIADGALDTDYLGIYVNNDAVENIIEGDRNGNGSTTPLVFYLSYDRSDYCVEHNPDDKNTLLIFGLGV